MHPLYRPRIFHAETPMRDAVPIVDTALLDRVHGLGFDTWMIDVPPPAALAAHARAIGLGVMLRLSLDQPPTDHPLRNAHPEWQRPAGPFDDLPDPRRAAQAPATPALRMDDEATRQAIATWWISHLVSLQGIQAFCVSADGPAPPAFFAEVIAGVKAQAPDRRFLAYTPGAGMARAASLDRVGFDAAFSSSAWWDCRSDWLAQEARAMRGFETVVGMASVPATHFAAAGDTAADELSHARVRRSLLLAAMTVDGVLVSDQALRAFESGGDAGITALRRALALCAEKSRAQKPWHLISPPDSRLVVLHAGRSDSDEDESLVLVANAGDAALTVDVAGAVSREDGLALVNGFFPSLEAPEPGVPVTLDGAETRIYTARQTRSATVAPKEGRRSAEAAARLPRISIEDISPCVDHGRFVAKRSVGDTLVVEADIFGEGHDSIAAALRWRAVDEEGWNEVPMRLLNNDRWRAEWLMPRVGRYQYQVEAWLDVFGTFRHEIDKKSEAGQVVLLELREGTLLVQAALQRAEAEDRRQLATSLRRLLKTLESPNPQHDGTRNDPRIALMLSDEVHQSMAQADARAFRVHSAPVLQVDAERTAAGFSSWYELFPRSMGPDVHTHGTFLDIIQRLPDIEAMGFDTLYFPPIHPIGRKHRKGRNNSLDAGDDDVGSPYAIGSADGGHDALHPQLGTIEDFRTLRRAAAEHGLELALDFAIQCSPDHPWLTEHPDWFTWRPDGTIRYAENPPKKYQDIVNVDFYATGAVPGLWLALRDVVLFWVKEGVKVFRVDNPHTKPLPFWEWMIGEVRARHPDTIFLAEAFTRPKPMYRLAKVGFSQSYSYFTWRHTKQEFIAYLTELTQGEPREFFRPHFFVNTPDINPYFLQKSGRAGFVIRAALAATLSGLWGVYSGFEICEAAPVPGKEEYLDSEKYELRQRNWRQPGNIVHEITLLNLARRTNPALQSHHGVRFLKSSGDDILCFIKTATGPAGGRNIVLVAVCLDPHAAHECSVELPLEDWGLAEDASVACEDLVHGNHFTLRGRHHTLRLDPNNLAFTLWRLRPEGGV